jgi:hypothetical protein
VIPSRNRILLWIHKFEDNGSVRDGPDGASRSEPIEIFAEQGNNFSVVHVAQLSNIMHPGHKQKKFGMNLEG